MKVVSVDLAGRATIWVLATVALAMLFSTCTGQPAYARPGDVKTAGDGQLWACHVPEKTAVEMKSYATMIKGRPYISIGYDRNGDGKLDMELVYGVKGKTLNPLPSYYVFGNKAPEKAYADRQGTGRCEDIVEVPLSELYVGQAPSASPPDEGMDPSCHGDAEEGEHDPNNPKKEL